MYIINIERIFIFVLIHKFQLLLAARNRLHRDIPTVSMNCIQVPKKVY